MRNFLKLISMLLCMVLPIVADALPITREQAQKRAEEFLQTRKGARKLSPVVNRNRLAPRKTQAASEDALYYVFDRGENEGFIIVSGDDATEPILGYCDAGSFDYANMPPNMQTWLEGYANELRALQQASGIVIGEAVPTHPAVATLMDCTWNQGDPYNQSCPMYFSLGRSVTGCVATAMAQIMYHQRSKSVTETTAAIPAYDTWTEHETYGRLHVDGIPAGSPIDWDNMLPSYSGGGTGVQKKAVADLMLYCGVSVEMDYTNKASGAQSYKVAEALRNYFGYGNSVRYVSATNYSDSDWDALIYDEIARGCPVYLSGANDEAGHAFVTDGYDGSRHYHINWGWGGSNNGYYLLTALNPGDEQGIGGSSGGYNAYRDAIVGIEPENYGTKAMAFSDATVRRLSTAAWDADGDGTLTYSEAAAVTDLGNVFANQRIINFSEFRYFTGLTEIGDSAFAGCTSLKTLSMPRNVTRIGANAFESCRSLKTLELPSGVTSIGHDAFSGCKGFTDITLPTEIKAIEARTFENCTALTEMTLPLGVKIIGERAFAGCTKLKDFHLAAPQAQAIELEADVFSGIDLSTARLTAIEGNKAYLSTAEQWKDFGTIYELRDLSRGKFIPLEVKKKVWIYNVATGRYITRGEAYGTQAVAGNDPMCYELRRSAAMGTDIYGLYSDETGNGNHYLFRTSNDDRVGTGVRATFVDGANLTLAESFWKIVDIGDNVYTIQTPSNATGYNSKQFLGVQLDHVSNFTTPTYGLYSDVEYSTHEAGCQWRFVEYNEDYKTILAASQELAGLLAIASSRNQSFPDEQAIYDNTESTAEELKAASHRVRKRLGLVAFADDLVHEISVNNWDVDGNGEISSNELAGVEDLGSAFYNKSITSFDELQLFTGLTRLYGNSFENCTKLESIVLPSGLTTIYYRAFRSCSKLKEINIPEFVTYIGDNVFDGCVSLRTVRVYNPDPSSIALKSDVFLNVNLSKATLYVPRGSKELFEAAPVWKNFGTIKEMRTHTMPAFSSIQADRVGYIYNIGMRKYLTKGEAYGTQAVVGRSGMRYQFKRTSSMAEGVYYLYSTETGQNGNVLFRTSTDSKVGTGVKACFVDGNVAATAYWNVVEGEDNIFTMQVPSTDKTYVEGEFLGTQSDHETAVDYYTNGVYWDIKQSDLPENCQWGFIAVEDMQAANAFDELVEELRKMLVVAAKKDIDIAEEQAVYDNFDSTTDAIEDAIASLRKKLHYIEFTDTRARSISVGMWDMDEDGELSEDEAAAITNIGENFRSATGLRSFDELRYFTGLTTIPANAFRGTSSLTSIYIPAGVKTIGESAFASCNSLKYMVLLSENVVDAPLGSLPANITVFVPKDLIADYQAHETWGKQNVVEYTGQPVVTVNDAQRNYGRSNPSFTFAVTGAPVLGTPVFSCEAEATTPVGQYPIEIAAGSISTADVTFVPGTLTVAPGQLTITAKSYTRDMGEANPEFEVSYRGFQNREKADVLTKQPVIECDATAESPRGEYEIRVSGAEAANYEITYVFGVLTIDGPVAIKDVRGEKGKSAIHDLQGRRVSKPARGVYVVNGQKVIVR